MWPDAHTTTDPRTGVDALTYGLATLCMGELAPSRLSAIPQQYSCVNCGSMSVAQCSHVGNSAPSPTNRRISNQYPQFTRKFSLGNGPPDWVQEYLITKESGKMLGTLVALAVARMTNLETFVWDMPTGVLRDVWLALSSLQTRNISQRCRLERVWVRWHDNTDSTSMIASQTMNAAPSTTPQMLAGSVMTPIGWSIPAGSVNPSQHLPRWASFMQSRVEYPTLSVLPPLKSLSVLDVDELDYLDEMSVLIAKSKDILRELRVGISAKAINRDFALAWDGPDLQQVDHNASWPGAAVIGERRLGGVLGVLLGRVHDIRRKQRIKSDMREHNTSIASETPIPTETPPVSSPPLLSGEGLITTTSSIEDWKPSGTPEHMLEAVPHHATASVPPRSDGLGLNPDNRAIAPDSAQSDVESLTALMSAYELNSQSTTSNKSIDTPVPPQLLRRSKPPNHRQSHFSENSGSERRKLDGKLTLQVLELERVPLSITVLQKAFDWSVLTDLTILDCPQHEQLWLMLRRQFRPTLLTGHHSSSKHTSAPNYQYHLNLKKVHTDATTPALIKFLRETLASDTLECLFLQDRRRSPTANVTIVSTAPSTR